MADEAPKPSGGGGRDKRVDFRVEMPLAIRYRVAVRRDDGRYQLSQPFNGVGVNFSGSGAAFRMAKDIPKGYMLLLEIAVPYDKDPIRAVAEVIKTQPDTLKGKTVVRCITRYLLIHPETQDKMIGFFIGEAARQQKT